MSIRLVLAVVGVSLSMLACGNSGAQGDSPSVATVEIYSGRPNPKWTLDQSARSAVVKALDGLPVGRQLKSPDASKLGFRWIEVSNLDTSHGRVTRAKVTPRVVALELSADRRTVLLEDSQSRTLQELLRLGAGRVDADVLNLIRQQIR
ncbi:hypothetical protein [Rhizohabitans arisaemae]|uniref:hypothetical protein n=1 Tax=Rhizohabitans arisaemae TaxID=2720610 RepID=UPI0024B1909C|nr:hypothetical protein [Rhizohabitans arisaemae]